MKLIKKFERTLPPGDRRLFTALASPAQIQAFLDSIPYSAEAAYRCPSSVLRDRQAHCYDGALFAAAALRRLGHPPLILNMLADHDDDHLVALYRRRSGWGAVAKSNFVGLRYREAVYRSVRELVMSYFEQFYNVTGLKTLRSYVSPLNLTAFDRLDWLGQDAPMEVIARWLDRQRPVRLVTAAMVRHLAPVDERSYHAGMFGVNPLGLYQPEALRRRPEEPTGDRLCGGRPAEPGGPGAG